MTEIAFQHYFRQETVHFNTQTEFFRPMIEGRAGAYIHQPQFNLDMITEGFKQFVI